MPAGCSNVERKIIFNKLKILHQEQEILGKTKINRLKAYENETPYNSI
jgi:hypothetical protein